MTLLPLQVADEVRRRYPDWLIWHLCPIWWAKHTATDAALTAADLDQLAELLAEATPP